MNPLDQLIFEGKSPPKKFKPFKDWKNSRLQNVEVTMRLLTAGENDDITSSIGSLPITSQISKIIMEQLARSLVTINGEAVASEENVRKYNESHNLEGNQKITATELVVMKLKDMDQSIIDVLNNEYSNLQKEHEESLREVKKKSPKNQETEPSGKSQKPPDLTES